MKVFSNLNEKIVALWLEEDTYRMRDSRLITAKIIEAKRKIDIVLKEIFMIVHLDYHPLWMIQQPGHNYQM